MWSTVNDGFDKDLEEPVQKVQCWVLNMLYNISFYFNSCFRTFFLGSGFFRIGSGFLADPDPDSEKGWSGSGKKNRIRKKTGFETLATNPQPVMSHTLLEHSHLVPVAMPSCATPSWNCSALAARSMMMSGGLGRGKIRVPSRIRVRHLDTKNILTVLQISVFFYRIRAF